MPAYKLRSVTILHRHGARGPGESELSPWDESNPVFNQWDNKDLEIITKPGHIMMESLGVWFSDYIARHGLLNDPKDCQVLWRCSKSDRAKESGEDFVSALNKSLGKEVFSNDPNPFDENPDVYFRPWKVYTAEVSKTKTEVLSSFDFKQKLEENERFLQMIGDMVKVKQDYKVNLGKCLWSMTHIQNVLECEKWWYSELTTDGKLRRKQELTKLLTDPVVKRKLEELACWVLDQRFVESTFRIELGGIMCDEVLQTILEEKYKVSVYSGHDYTILAVLSAMGIIDRLQVPLSFGCFLLFEIWEYDKPCISTSTSMSTKNSNVNSNLIVKEQQEQQQEQEEMDRLVRVILNPCPFKPPAFDGSPLFTSELPVHDNESIVLAEVDIKEMHQILGRIQGHFMKKGLSMSKSGRLITAIP